MTDKVIGPTIIHYKNDQNETEDVGYQTKEFIIRFGNIRFRDFYCFINEIENIKQFKNFASRKFIEENVFFCGYVILK